MADQSEQLSKLYGELKRRPQNCRFKELLKLMTLAGFEHRFTKSAHGVLFWHKTYAVIVSAANPKDGPVLSAYIRDCFAAIEDVKHLEENSDA